MAKSKAIATLSTISTKAFLDKVKEKYVERYADDVVNLLEDKKRLEKALEKVNNYLIKIEAGDMEAVLAYKKARQKLEAEDNGELE